MDIDVVKNDNMLDYSKLDAGDIFSFVYGYEWSDFDNICLKCKSGYVDLTISQLVDEDDSKLEKLDVVRHKLIEFTIKRG